MTLSRHEQATTQQAPRQVVDALLAAIQSGDRDEILALLSESVEQWVAGPPEIPYAGTFRGHDEVVRFFATFNDAFGQDVVAGGWWLVPCSKFYREQIGPSG